MPSRAATSTASSTLSGWSTARASRGRAPRRRRARRPPARPRSAESMPAGEAEDDVVEPVLPHVVARGRGRARGRSTPAARPQPASCSARAASLVDVDEQQVLVEHRRPARDLSVRCPSRASRRRRRARPGRRRRSRTRSTPPNSRADPGGRRAAPRACRRWYGDPLMLVDERDAPVVGERAARLPGVLADRQAHGDAAHRDLLGPLAGHEVPLLVEDPEVRQHDLVVAGADLAAGEERRPRCGARARSGPRTRRSPDRRRRSWRRARRARRGCRGRTRGGARGPPGGSR